MQESRALSRLGAEQQRELEPSSAPALGACGCPDVPDLHCPRAGGVGEWAGRNPAWGRAVRSLCRKKSVLSPINFFVFLQYWSCLLELASYVLYLILPWISQADSHLETWLSRQLGGAQVKLSLWSRCQRKVTDHLAESSDTKKEPTFPPWRLSTIYLPWDLPSSSGSEPGIPGQLCWTRLC